MLREQGAYRIDVEVPLRARLVEMDEDLLYGNLKLCKDEMDALAPWAVRESVKGDLGRDAGSFVASHGWSEGREATELRQSSGGAMRFIAGRPARMASA